MDSGPGSRLPCPCRISSLHRHLDREGAPYPIADIDNDGNNELPVKAYNPGKVYDWDTSAAIRSPVSP